MARRERHPVDLARVPGGDDLPPGVRVFADELDEVGDLVDVAAVGALPVAPLLAVNGTEVAGLVRPFVADADVALFQPVDVGVAPKEPQQFDDDRSQMELLSGEEREAVGEIEAHLRAEPRPGACSRAILLLDSVVEDELHEIEILAHARAILIDATE